MTKVNLEKLNEFCEAWIAKANEADTGHIAGVFDRFFALWVVYNRLYEEAARTLAYERHPWTRGFLHRRKRPFAPPPDRAAATKGIVLFCGQSVLKSATVEHRDRQRVLGPALQAIESGLFFLHENYETGEPDHKKDRDLAERAREGDMESLLTLVYQARCNLFHGQKAYSEIQRPLLEGMIAVLLAVIEQTRAAMQSRV